MSVCLFFLFLLLSLFFVVVVVVVFFLPKVTDLSIFISASQGV